MLMNPCLFSAGGSSSRWQAEARGSDYCCERTLPGGRYSRRSCGRTQEDQGQRGPHYPLMRIDLRGLKDLSWCLSSIPAII